MNADKHQDEEEAAFVAPTQDNVTQALNTLQAEYVKFLQTMMAASGYDESQRSHNHPTFHLVYLFSLQLIFKALRSMKETFSEKINEEETFIISRLPSNAAIEISSKISRFNNLWELNFGIALRNTMVKSGFVENDISENNETYRFFFSQAFIMLSKNLLTNSYVCYERDFSHEQSKKSFWDELLRYKELQSVQRIKLVTTTKHHYLYYILTSLREFALKVPRPESLSGFESDSVDTEHIVSLQVQHPSVRKAVKKLKFNKRECLLLDWVDGFPINLASSIIKDLSVIKFLKIAREIVSAVLTFHEKSIMLSSLSCDHVMLSETLETVKIIGIGSAVTFRNLQQKKYRGDLRCVPPEQTRLLNRTIDYRSDFYSLGVIFFYLLSGRYPFENKSSLKLINMHILEKPPSLHDLNPKVPVNLSHLVSKLLQKEAHDRYQSARGIIHDLDLMLSEIQNDSKLQSIVLAQHDQSKSLLLPSQPQGRSSEYSYLCEMINRSVSSKSFEQVFISGCSGTGKTALIKELYGPVAEKNGIMMIGKFDQYRKDPFLALFEAMNSFCEMIMMAEEKVRAKYENRILHSLGDEGKLLTDAVSKLAFIIGKQPPTTDAIAQDAKNKIKYLLGRFFKAICSVEPVMLVLEDIHWIDSNSSDFLSDMMKEKCAKNLMLIFSYRNDEIEYFPLVARLLDAAGDNKKCIELENFDHECTNNLLAKTLRISSYECYSLSSFIFRRSKGNPFHTIQWLKSLHEKKLIFFSVEELTWQWDLSGENEQKLAEDAKQHLCAKIKSFEKPIQETLKIASCLGSPFHRVALKIILNNNKAIEDTLSTGMIVQSEFNEKLCNFSHDQLQQACNSLLPQDSSALFMYISKKLWKCLSEDELEDNLFVIVNLLANSLEKVKENEKLIVAKIYTRAAEKALRVTAFELAFNYLLTAKKMLDEKQCWDKDYDLTLKIFDLACRTAYSVNNFEMMNSTMKEIVGHVRSPVHILPSSVLKIRLYKDNRQFDKAAEEGIAILKKFGENINYDAFDEECKKLKIHQIQLQLATLSNEDIIKRTEMVDEVSLSVMKILSEILNCAWFGKPLLSPLVCTRMIELTLEKGISMYSCHAFASFAVFLARGDATQYRLGNLSLNMLKQFKTREMFSRVHNVYCSFISPYYEPFSETCTYLLKATKVSLEIGSHSDCFLNISLYVSASFVTGSPLPKLMRDIEEILQLISGVKITPYFSSIVQAINNLLGRDVKNPNVLSGTSFDSSILRSLKVTPHVRARASIICGIIAYLFHDYPLAFTFFQTSRALKKFFERGWLYSFFIFYEALSAIALAKTREKKVKSELLHRTQENITALTFLAKTIPENYINKIHGLEAEKSLEEGDLIRAEKNFKEAITLSEKHGFIHEKAIFCERYGIALLETNKSAASEYLNQSLRCFHQWGAAEKEKDLKKMYSCYISNDLELGVEPMQEDLLEVGSQSSVSQITTDLFSTLNVEGPKKRPRLED